MIKNVNIPKKGKQELFIFLGCILMSFILNICSILFYKTKWIELITTIHISIAVAFVMYIILWVFRLIWMLTGIIIHRK